MIKTLLVLIGTIPYLQAVAESIDYEPIKITVNENFNAQPGQIAQGLPSLVPSFVHQGANFYFNPRLLLPPDYIQSEMETFVSSLHHKGDYFAKNTPSKITIEKEEITVAKQLDHNLLDCTKETPTEIVIEKEKITEITKPLDDPQPEIPVKIEIIEVSTPTPTEIIIDEKVEVNPPSVSVTINEDPVTPERIPVIPEAPVLPPLSFDVISPVIVEEVKIEEPILVEEFLEVFPPVPEISTGAILEPIVIPEISDSYIFDDILQPNPCSRCIIKVMDNIPPVIIPKFKKSLDVYTSIPVAAQLPKYVPIIQNKIVNPDAKDFILRRLRKLPLASFSKPSIKIIMTPKSEEKNEFQYITSCAHNIVAERIAPYIISKNITPQPLKIDFRSIIANSHS